MSHKPTPSMILLNADASTVVLRSGSFNSGGGIQVDRATGLIKGVSVITTGPARGHGFTVDSVLLSQIAEQINAAGGVKVRMGHPSMIDDGTGLAVGSLINARVEGNRVRGDLQLGQFAKSTAKGDMWTHVLDLASERPDFLGLSVAFEPTQAIADGVPVRRSKRVVAVDLVDDPAANRSGLLSNPASGNVPGLNASPGGDPGNSSSSKGSLMNPRLKKYLISLGLKADANDTDAVAYLSALSGDQKEIAAGLMQTAPAPAPAAAPAPAPAAPVQLSAEQAVAEERKAEKARLAAITALSSTYKLGDGWLSEMVNGGFSVSDATAKALEKVAQANKPLALSGGEITGGENLNIATLGAAISDAVLLRSNAQLRNVEVDGQNYKLIARQAHARAAEFRGLRLHEMAREYLSAVGVQKARQMSANEIAEMVMNRAKLIEAGGSIQLAMGVGDFTSILADTMGKTLRQAYIESPATWSKWCRRNTAPDYKTISRTQLSEAPTPTALPPSGEVKYATIVDGKETYQLADYGSGLVFSRRTIVNDDLEAFARIVPAQGASCRRLEEDLAYAVLTANAAMADTGNLFNTTAVTTTGGHANSGTGTITVANIGALVAKMKKQKGSNGAGILDLTPRFLIVPAALEPTAKQFVSSLVDPSKSNGTLNPYAGAFEVISTARLDATSAVAYYLAASYTQIDTVELGFLEGSPEPVLAQESDFDTEARKFRVRHTVAAKAIDWRGLVYSTGA